VGETFFLPCVDGDTEFPHPRHALLEPNGLLAYGGDLSSQRLLKAYQQGIFPWFNEDEPILWWSPHPRMVLFPEKFHCSRSLQRFIKKTDYTCYWNRHFADVVRHCAAPRKHQPETWISPDMQQAYLQLFEQGHAFCVEIEYAGQLAGGLYGVKGHHSLFGESMFSSQLNGSKIALFEVCKTMLADGINILDCQVYSEHLATLGAELIDRRQFLQLIRS